MWNELSITLGIDAKHSAYLMLSQYIFEKLLERVVKERADTPGPSQVTEGLTEIEHIAVRYSAVFLVRKLKE